ncbi:unnamed protein product [Urochloa decumbens]|uniref:SCP domain-containing protein n=1 Tax=Urochloa decumbens TaxID=240449 RepID=A0ABC9GC90_9POAL
MAAYSSTKLVTCLALAVAAILVPLCAAQNSPEDFVDLHNAARAEVGVGPVSWDETVAAFAESYAALSTDDCTAVHSSGSEYYGENILVGGAGYDWSASDAVGYWVAEKQWYDHGSNSCSAPEGESCGHYTQVVWRDSTTIGCARAVCSDGSVFFTCNYNPPGNYIGESPY